MLCTILSAVFGAALLDTRCDLFGAGADPAIASLRAPHDGARVGRWIGRFLDAA